MWWWLRRLDPAWLTAWFESQTQWLEEQACTPKIPRGRRDGEEGRVAHAFPLVFSHSLSHSLSLPASGYALWQMKEENNTKQKTLLSLLVVSSSDCGAYKIQASPNVLLLPSVSGKAETPRPCLGTQELPRKVDSAM